MSWKEKRLITILSIILAVLCAAVLLVLSVLPGGAGRQGGGFPDLGIGHRAGRPERLHNPVLSERDNAAVLCIERGRRLVLGERA